MSRLRRIGITPYYGIYPYVFVSYSHRDSSAAKRIIGRAKRAGYRIWFDEAIPGGVAWQATLVRRIKSCECFLALLSKDYIQSEDCLDELSLACDCRKPRILINLDNVTLPDDAVLRNSRIQMIIRSEYDADDTFYREVFRAPAMAKCLSYSRRQAPPNSAPMHITAVETPGTLAAVMSGTVRPIRNSSGMRFSSPSYGKGIIIEPTNGAVYSPARGRVVSLPRSKHAIEILTNNGARVLIHIGINTKDLNGLPFRAHVDVGDMVEAGDLLIEANLSAIAATGRSTTTMVAIINADAFTSVIPLTGLVKAGQTCCMLIK